MAYYIDRMMQDLIGSTQDFGDIHALAEYLLDCGYITTIED